MEDMNIGLSVKRVNLYTGREENAFLQLYSFLCVVALLSTARYVDSDPMLFCSAMMSSFVIVPSVVLGQICD